MLARKSLVNQKYSTKRQTMLKPTKRFKINIVQLKMIKHLQDRNTSYLFSSIFITELAPKHCTHHHPKKNTLVKVKRKFFLNVVIKILLNSETKHTVVMRACFQSGSLQSHFKAGEIIDNIIISIESAIQERPVMSDSFT